MSPVDSAGLCERGASDMCLRVGAVNVINGSECPKCGGHVTTDDGTVYRCEDCGAEFDTADLFLP